MHGACACRSPRAVPLDGYVSMPAHRIRGALRFLPAPGARPGGSCRVELIADGIHVPDFSAFTMQAGRWSNCAGVLHVVEFLHAGDALQVRITLTAPLLDVVHA
jgi:hypothetical protein